MESDTHVTTHSQLTGEQENEPSSMPAARQSGQRLVMCAPCWSHPGPPQRLADIVVLLVPVVVVVMACVWVGVG